MPNLAGLQYCREEAKLTATQTAETQTPAEAQTLLLKRDEVLALLKCTRATLFRLMDERGFPRPIKLVRANRWFEIEVMGWIEHQSQARDERDVA